MLQQPEVPHPAESTDNLERANKAWLKIRRSPTCVLVAFSLAMKLVLLLLLTLIAQPVLGCNIDEDCNLNGLCTAGSCTCNAGERRPAATLRDVDCTDNALNTTTDIRSAADGAVLNSLHRMAGRQLQPSAPAAGGDARRRCDLRPCAQPHELGWQRDLGPRNRASPSVRG